MDVAAMIGPTASADHGERSQSALENLRRAALLTDARHRMRDVRRGPDGLLYVLIGDEDGAILRIDAAG